MTRWGLKLINLGWKILIYIILMGGDLIEFKGKMNTCSSGKEKTIFWKNLKNMVSHLYKKVYCKIKEMKFSKLVIK